MRMKHLPHLFHGSVMCFRRRNREETTLGIFLRFLSVMRQQGVHAYNVTGDHVRLYKEAMKDQGNKPATIARALSVIRGTYEQFGKKGLGILANRRGHTSREDPEGRQRNNAITLGDKRRLHSFMLRTSPL